MKCEAVLENLSLYPYGELTQEQRAAVEDHLEACPECRAEYERERALHETLDERDAGLPPGLLTRCRTALREEIARLEGNAGRREAQGRAGWWQSVVDLLEGIPAGWMKPAGAVALVAIGFVGARLTHHDPAPFVPGVDREIALPAATSVMRGQAPLLRVRSIEAGQDNRLRIRVEEVRERVVQGTPDNEAVRALLISALRESVDPGLRGESLDLLKGDPEAAEVRSTLLNVLQHDPNPGVRLKALDGLKAYASDSQVRSVLKNVLLSDENPALRMQVIDILSSQRESRMVPVLQELLRKEENAYIRAKCQNVLREMNASAEIF